MKPNPSNLFKYIAGLNLLVAPLALAQTGDRGGNGGDVIVCQDGSVRMLDSVEASQANLPISFPESSSTLRQKIEIIIDRQMTKDLILGRLIQKHANTLLTDLENFEATGNGNQLQTQVREGELPNISDEGATFVPVGCKIEQLIVRTPHPMPNQKQYSVRKDLYLRMTTDERAIAVIHESIYAYLVDKGVNSSPSARWYNGLLFSDSLKTISDIELANQMNQFKFPGGNWERESFGFIYDPLTQVTYAADGSIALIKNATLSPNLRFSWINGSQMIPQKVKNVIVQNGTWQQMTYVASDHTRENIDLDTKEVLNWSVYWGGPEPTASAKDVSRMNLKNRRVVGLDKATLVRTTDGYEISNARKYTWKIDPVVSVPVVGQVMLIDGHVMRERWTPTTLKLDQNLNVLEVISPKISWRKMGRY